MTLKINGITFHNVEAFSLNDCEISMIFEDSHPYSSIEELSSILEQAGIHIGNYHFNCVDCYGDYFKPESWSKSTGTDILAVYHGRIYIERES